MPPLALNLQSVSLKQRTFTRECKDTSSKIEPHVDVRVQHHTHLEMEKESYTQLNLQDHQHLKITTKDFNIKTNLYLGPMILTMEVPPATVSFHYSETNSALLQTESPVPIPQQCYVSLQKNPDTKI